MTIDDDPDVAALALSTIDAIPPQALTEFFARADAPRGTARLVRSAQRGAARAPAARR